MKYDKMCIIIYILWKCSFSWKYVKVNIFKCQYFRKVSILEMSVFFKRAYKNLFKVVCWLFLSIPYFILFPNATTVM